MPVAWCYAESLPTLPTPPTILPPLIEAPNMQFRHKAIGQERPGGASPTINKTIDERMDIKPGAEESPEMKSDKKPIAPGVKISFSSEKVHFSVRGSPGEYDADSTVRLTVESKHGFVVKAHATSLRSNAGDIPPERLFVNVGDRYLSLERGVIVLEREYEMQPKKERTASTNLNFKLKTTWDDRAGEYTGEIIFTYTAL